jgi:hypothetical protein
VWVRGLETVDSRIGRRIEGIKGSCLSLFIDIVFRLKQRIRDYVLSSCLPLSYSGESYYWRLCILATTYNCDSTFCDGALHNRICTSYSRGVIDPVT